MTFSFSLSVEDGLQPEVSIQASEATGSELEAAILLMEASLRRVKEHSVKKFGEGKVLRDESAPPPSDEQRRRTAAIIRQEEDEKEADERRS